MDYRRIPEFLQGSADDPNLIDALTTPAELSGLLNLALDGLDRLHRAHAFTYGRTVEETSEYYLRAADPVYAFIQDCCEIGSGLWVSKEDAYNAFKANCEAKQIPLLRPNSFARALQNQPSVRVTPFRPEVNGERIQAWQGITLCKEKADGAKKTLTQPRLASGMSGQNDTSNAYAHGNSSLKLQKNADNPDATLKSDFQNPDATIKNPDGDYAVILGMIVDQVLETWRKHGAPIIPSARARTVLTLNFSSVPLIHQLGSWRQSKHGLQRIHDFSVIYGAPPS